MKKEALLEVADMLDNLKLRFNEKFDMTYWKSIKTKFFGLMCNTAACAIGWKVYYKI